MTKNATTAGLSKAQQLKTKATDKNIKKLKQYFNASKTR